jgi:hypothetical protein
MAAFLAQMNTASIQRPIFAAADLENHLRANQASDPAAFGRSRALSGCAAFSSRRALRDGFYEGRLHDRPIRVSREA